MANKLLENLKLCAPKTAGYVLQAWQINYFLYRHKLSPGLPLMQQKY